MLPFDIVAPRPLLAGLALTAALLATPAVAHAQLHWDASLQAGAMKRFVSKRPPGVGDVSLGPAAELHGHVALLPLLRVGAYVGHDATPQPQAAAWQTTSFGVRAKVTSPIPSDPWKIWAFVGFGYALTYGPSFTMPVSGQGPNGVLVEGVNGGFVELPFGIGASYKFLKPWSLTAELGGRGSFGHTQGMFGNFARRTSSPTIDFVEAGVPSFGVGLMLGVGVDM
jgi:hypothetical protein